METSGIKVTETVCEYDTREVVDSRFVRLDPSPIPPAQLVYSRTPSMVDYHEGPEYSNTRRTPSVASDEITQNRESVPEYSNADYSPAPEHGSSNSTASLDTNKITGDSLGDPDGQTSSARSSLIPPEDATAKGSGIPDVLTDPEIVQPGSDLNSVVASAMRSFELMEQWLTARSE